MTLSTQVTFTQAGAPDVMSFSHNNLLPPQADQVQIRVHAAGVNGPDIKQRMGAYPAPEGASPILGLEVSGEITAIGDNVSEWKLGDKVCALVPGGGYSQYVNTFAKHCLPIPKGLDFTQAAALPETLFTVWGNLFMRAGLKAGETVLIHGGSGVIVTSGSAEKCEYCLGQGARVAINYNEQDFVEPVLAATQGKGVDVVLDIAGGDFINQNLKALAMDGRMVSVAMQRGPQAQVDIFRIMAKRITWTGSTLRPQSVEAKANIATELAEKVWPLIEQGKISIPLDSVYPFEAVVAAHQRMESGQHKGKIVLDLMI
jgi:NADPH2:quinone reductase